jgi:hypothetical protein
LAQITAGYEIQTNDGVSVLPKAADASGLADLEMGETPLRREILWKHVFHKGEA